MEILKAKKTKLILRVTLPCIILYFSLMQLLYFSSIANVYWISYTSLVYLLFSVIFSITSFIKSKEPKLFISFLDYELNRDSYDNNSKVDDKLLSIYAKFCDLKHNLTTDLDLFSVVDLLNKLNLPYKENLEFTGLVNKKVSKVNPISKHSKIIYGSLIIILVIISVLFSFEIISDYVLFYFSTVVFIFIAISTFYDVTFKDYEIKNLDTYKSKRKYKKYTEIYAYSETTKDFIILAEFEINQSKLSEKSFEKTLENLDYLKQAYEIRLELFHKKSKGEISILDYKEKLNTMYNELIFKSPYIMFDLTKVIYAFEEKYDMSSVDFKEKFEANQLDNSDDYIKWYSLLN